MNNRRDGEVEQRQQSSHVEHNLANEPGRKYDMTLTQKGLVRLRFIGRLIIITKISSIIRVGADNGKTFKVFLLLEGLAVEGGEPEG